MKFVHGSYEPGYFVGDVVFGEELEEARDADVGGEETA
jgi:hypothetical protein